MTRDDMLNAIGVIANRSGYPSGSGDVGCAMHLAALLPDVAFSLGPHDSIAVFEEGAGASPPTPTGRIWLVWSGMRPGTLLTRQLSLLTREDGTFDVTIRAFVGLPSGPENVRWDYVTADTIDAFFNMYLTTPEPNP
jgi:hypothetical protein